ncbi:Obg family GTPase CgtA, partial [Chloroflexota bacterium]
LAQKPQLVTVNKIDLPEVQARLSEIEDAVTDVGTTPYFISAVTEEGIKELMAEAMKLLDIVADEAKAGEQLPKKIFRPQPRGAAPNVHKEGDTFVVESPELERLVGRIDGSGSGVLGGYLRRLGLSKALQRSGVKPGDKVRCGNLEWEWQ